MNSRNRLYIMAFAVYTTALLAITALAGLALQYSTAAGVVQLAVALSGNGIGGFALVLGILRDDRVQKAEEKAAKARQESEQFKQESEHLKQESEQFKQQAEQLKQESEQFKRQAERLEQQAALERQRAERAEAELERVRAERDREIAARIRRLEIAAGFTTPDASDDATEN